MPRSTVPAHKQRPVCKDCFLAGWVGALFLKKGGGARGKEVMRHLIRVGVDCLSGAWRPGRGRVAALALDTFTDLPSRGCYTFPGRRGPEALHIRLPEITPGWTLPQNSEPSPSPQNTHPLPKADHLVTHPGPHSAASFLFSLPTPL